MTEIVARTKGRPAAAARAGVTLRAYLAKHAGAGLPVADVARALAIAEARGLTARDLYDITGRRFAVVPILRGHPAFVRDDEGRWHLGKPAGTPRR